MLGARNKFKGIVKGMTMGQAMAEVIISSGGKPDIVSLISRDKARRMGLKVGDKVSAVIKPTEVIVEKG